MKLAIQKKSFHIIGLEDVAVGLTKEQTLNKLIVYYYENYVNHLDDNSHSRFRLLARKKDGTILRTEVNKIHNVQSICEVIDVVTEDLIALEKRFDSGEDIKNEEVLILLTECNDDDQMKDIKEFDVYHDLMEHGSILRVKVL